MPNYDWKCQLCEKQFERVESPETIDRQCPFCGGWANRLPSAPSFKITGGTPKFHNTGRTK